MSNAIIDGLPLDLDVAQIDTFVHLTEVGSTMDHAHALATDGAGSGTVVVADVQTAGRGRVGKAWISEAGAGLWFTLIERTVSPEAMSVLSLRVGLAIADAVSPWCDGTVWLKWPNDVLVGDALGPSERDAYRARMQEHAHRPNAAPDTSASHRSLAKLAGVLVEARWRESVVDWVAIGIGINLRKPASSVHAVAAGLTRRVSRARLLEALVPRVRMAARAQDVLTTHEMRAWRERDAMHGQRAVEPEFGVVDGIERDGGLRIVTVDGSVRTCRSGSLVLAT